EVRVASMKHDVAQAGEKAEAERARRDALVRQAAAEERALAADERSVAGGRGKAGEAEAQSEAAKRALARTTAAPAGPAQALRDLKEAKKREAQTYSVVPYRGKQGDNRRPLYVECSAKGVVFHPGKVELSVEAAPAEVRAEAERRIARQKAQLTAAGQATD